MKLLKADLHSFTVICSPDCPIDKSMALMLPFEMLRPADLDRVIANSTLVLGVLCINCNKPAINEATLYKLGQAHDRGGPAAVIDFLQKNGG